jgi:hypothetical protein
MVISFCVGWVPDAFVEWLARLDTPLLIRRFDGPDVR